MTTGRNKRKVDNLLVLLLFGIFAICILSLLLTGADVYQRLAERDQYSYHQRTAAQYLATRVRQADRLGTVTVRPFEEETVLVFAESIEGGTYETLVYCYDGYLRELFVSSESIFALEDGERIMPAQSMSIRQDGQLLNMELTSYSGDVQTLELYLRSRKGAPK